MATKTKAKARRKAPAKTARKAARRGSDLVQMVKMLEDDHSKVDKLFKRYEKLMDADNESRYDLVPQICMMLKVHMVLEEKLLYPPAEDIMGDDADMVDEAEVEHMSAKQLISEIEKMKTSEKLYDAKVKVLGEYINHHVEEEEEELFPKLKKKADDEYEGVFEQMKEMRRTLEDDMGADKMERAKRGGHTAHGSAAH